jgi:hypothetical protein
VQGVEGAHWAVRKAVYHLQSQPVAVEEPEDAAAALGTEVEGQEFLGSGHDEVRVLFDKEGQMGIRRARGTHKHPFDLPHAL